MFLKRAFNSECEQVAIDVSCYPGCCLLVARAKAKCEPFAFEAPGIEFANGIVERGDEYVISYGREDVSAHLGIIDKKIVSRLMKSVD